MGPATPHLRRSPTAGLTRTEVRRLRHLLDSAFEAEDGFGEDDWRHAVGGTHYLIELGDSIVAHAAVVERILELDGQPLRTGYVEAVATDPSQQRAGLGSLVVTAVSEDIREGFELGGLSTGHPQFYERLGWQRWTGPTFVRTDAGLERTADDDGGILVLPTPRTPELDLDAAISCDWRPGDVW